jgi:hypothetical protein
MYCLIFIISNVDIICPTYTPNCSIYRHYPNPDPNNGEHTQREREGTDHHTPNCLSPSHYRVHAGEHRGYRTPRPQIATTRVRTALSQREVIAFGSIIYKWVADYEASVCGNVLDEGDEVVRLSPLFAAWIRVSMEELWR